MESNNASSTLKVLNMSVTIGRLRMVLRTQQLSAQPLQQRCSLWFHQEFRDQLDQCLTQVQQELGGTSLVLDGLRLNLGDIRAQQFEHDLSERAIKALVRELALHVAVNNVDDKRAYLRVDGEGDIQDEGAQSEPQGTLPKPEIADEGLILLLAYLDTGRRHSTLRWLPPSSPSQWLHAQLDRWQTCEAAWQGRVEFAWRCLGRLSSQRLVATFTPTVLARLSRWLLAATPAAAALGLSNRQACDWLPLAAVLALRHDTTSSQAVTRRMSEEQWHMVDLVHGRGGRLQEGVSITTKSEPRRTSLDMIHGEENPPFKRHLLGRWPIPGPLSALGRLLLAEPFTPATYLAIRLILTHWASFSPLQNEEGVHLRSMLSAAVERGTAPEPSGNPASRMQESASASQAEATHKLANPLPSLQPVGITPSAVNDLEHLELSGAGIVLLWPLLPDLFEAHALIDSSGFIDEASQVQAVMLLDALVWGDSAVSPWRLEEFCYWCGLPAERILQDPDTWRTLDSGLLVQLDAWLVSVLAQVPGLDGFDAPSLRALFLQRSGQLVVLDTWVRLTLDAQAQDALLRDCPWPLSHLTLPWLPLVVSLTWQSL